MGKFVRHRLQTRRDEIDGNALVFIKRQSCVKFNISAHELLTDVARSKIISKCEYLLSRLQSECVRVSKSFDSVRSYAAFVLWREGEIYELGAAVGVPLILICYRISSRAKGGTNTATLLFANSVLTETHLSLIRDLRLMMEDDVERLFERVIFLFYVNLASRITYLSWNNVTKDVCLNIIQTTY